ncbi:MAG: multidrug DMT transporter permease [Jatrophihabitantaceae bacterium]
MAWAERVSSRSWRVRYWKDDGSVGSVYGFTTKTAAQHAADDMESDQRAGTFIDPHRGKTTLADWVDDWLPALDVDIRTEENYRGMLRRHILPRWGTTSLADISSIKVTAWAKTLRNDGLAPATVSGITKLFTMILADAVAERLIAYNPSQLRRRGRGRTVRPAEKIWATHEQALAVADQTADCYHPWGAMLIATAAWTGMRWGEITGLHRHNVHLDDGHLTIHPDTGALHESAGGKLWLGPPKNPTSARRITLPPFLIPLLQRHLDEVDADFVFVTPERQWHRRSNFARRATRPAADGTPTRRPALVEPNGTATAEADNTGTARTGRPAKPLAFTEPVAPGLTFHGLRHSHKTWMIADGLPEIAQSRRLGHILPDKIQETYSHVADEVEHRLLQALQDRWDKATANSTRADPPWRTPTTGRG